MLSIRTSRQFHGAPISLGALARLERREFPIKLSDLAQVAVHPFSNHISNGDVEIDWTATFASNGSWALSAHIVDTGDIAGDFYVLDFLLSALRQVGQRLSGHIDDGDSTDLHQSGIDPWVRENWSDIIENGVTVRLEVTPDVAEIIEIVTLVLVTAGAVIFFASPGKHGVRQCPDTFENNKQCVEFYKAEGDEPSGDTIGTIGTASFVFEQR